MPHWAERLVRILDDGLRIPGTSIRFGLDGILGLLLPEVGDALSALISLSLIWSAIQSGANAALVARMLLNIGIDALVGAVPVVGDLFDFAFKANRRNLNLLEARRDQAKVKLGVVEYLLFAVAGLFVLAAVALPMALMVMFWRWVFSG